MPRRPRALPLDLPDGFSTRSAHAAGVTGRRLRNADLLAPFYGVRLQKAAVERIVDAACTQLGRDMSPVAVAAECQRSLAMLRVEAFAQLAPPHFFFSHITAAVIWGVPLPSRVLIRDSRPVHVRQVMRSLSIDDILRDAFDLDVSTRAPRRAPRAAGIRGRQLSPALTGIGTHNSLQIVSPASMWAQLGTQLSVDELIAIGDALVSEPRVRGVFRARQGSGLATLAQLAAAVEAGRRSGAQRLREALAQVRVGSASQAETDLRLAIVRAGLPAPALDVDVMDAAGRIIGFTELAYPDFRLLIEYEGDHHRTDKDQWNRDIEKRRLCAEAGWTVLQINSRHLYPGSDAAVRLIRDALLRAGWRPAG